MSLLVVFPSQIHQSMIDEENYAQWLLISIFVSLPAISLRLLTFFKGSVKTEESWLLLKISSIVLPNYFSYLMVYSHQKVYLLPKIYFLSQILIVMGTKLCSIFNRSYLNEVDISVEGNTLGSLVVLIVFKFFHILGFLLPDNELKHGVKLLAGTFLIVGTLWMTFVVVKLTTFLWRQMNKSGTFKSNDQMKDFYRISGVIAFAAYFLTFNYLRNSSSFHVNFLIAQIFLMVYLNIVDQSCLLSEADEKEEQLRTRLNLMRYISHEMRSPINSAFLGLQILREHMASALKAIKHSERMSNPFDLLQQLKSASNQLAEGLETSDLIKESCCIALDTLNDMLTFDKIDEKKLVLEIEDFDIWSFVSEAVRPFHVNAMKAGVSLSLDCLKQESNWFKRSFVKADKYKLKQVVRNFVSNALKFCRKVDGVVQVRVEPLNHGETSATKGSKVVRVSVSDNGCGISKENQSRLFGQYVQFAASALQEGQGSGLGLWICKSKIF